MKEHEQLKEICNKIGYETKYNIDVDNIWFYEELNIDISNISSVKYSRYLDVREIIFTQEFMEKYKEYAYKLDNIDNQDIYDLLLHLDNPVWYLYDLVFKK